MVVICISVGLVTLIYRVILICQHYILCNEASVQVFRTLKLFVFLVLNLGSPLYILDISPL